MSLLLRDVSFFSHGELLTGQDILVQDGVIAAVGSFGSMRNARLDSAGYENSLVIPGLIDLQVNGGYDLFFTESITKPALGAICQDHLVRGTTSIMPTLVSTSLENMLAAIDVVESYWKDGGIGVLGLHLEGPYISMDRKGAHDPRYIRDPSDDELWTILNRGKGVVKMMTIAPELFSPGQISLIKDFGIVLAAGHSDLSESAARDAFKSGIDCVTHLYNAMSPLKSRESGLVGAALDSDVYASIIPDGFHCSMTALRVAYRLKKGRLFFVSDATSIGKSDVEIDGVRFYHRDGVYVNSAGNLAGSNITMLDAIRTASSNGLPLSDAIEMASAIPSALAGHSKRIGAIVAGKDADLVVLDKNTLAIRMVIRSGQVVRRE